MKPLCGAVLTRVFLTEASLFVYFFMAGGGFFRVFPAGLHCGVKLFHIFVYPFRAPFVYPPCVGWRWLSGTVGIKRPAIGDTIYPRQLDDRAKICWTTLLSLK
ncbi:hypothetical protein AU500_13865 [Lonsdalea populi]|uniref:Uncharacterized protein n=2 Tax=Lonsdalea TaxID=1082702 RepID=A0ACD1JD41_9GAMM|nr:hypothetical protein AU499_15330 [Lonsdalea populi]RAT13582.1 hypothetical protein AU485_08280 [Lonsdalea quercina]OSM98026.1 hypothetical protein AU508_04245 [Lonsdalea populi]RAT20033.1 hypothetical protein AU487_09235 [Lonsdalea populi]RAT24242.1 hypothetical protein AU489_09785 [Lonsdalea populi]